MPGYKTHVESSQGRKWDRIKPEQDGSLKGRKK